MSNGKMILFIVAAVVIAKALMPNMGTAADAASGARTAVSGISAKTATPPGGIAAHIRRCESAGNYRAQNSHSTASGAYQFIDGTWHGVTGLPGHAKNYPPAVQDRAFVKLWADGRGAHNWNASRGCWGRYWSG